MVGHRNLTARIAESFSTLGLAAGAVTLPPAQSATATNHFTVFDNTEYENVTIRTWEVHRVA